MSDNASPPPECGFPEDKMPWPFLNLPRCSRINWTLGTHLSFRPIMNSDTLPDLLDFADWLQQHDPHVQYHLRLLEQIEPTVMRGSPEARQRLATRLERWRYQHVQERSGWFEAMDHAFLDTLGEVTSHLTGVPVRSPRRTAQVLESGSAEPDAVGEALAMLAPEQPLDSVAARARELTQQHFAVTASSAGGEVRRRRMLLYAPLYVASHCINFCTYCGFRYPLAIPRRHLSLGEACEEIALLQQRGFGHLLIVGGEYPQLTSTEYYCRIAAAVAERGIVPAVEIAPQGTGAYGELNRAGVCGVTLYQETYDPERYAQYHPRGPKSHYHWRLEAHDRAAEAGMERLGLGVLLGLADLRGELRALMRHGAYLQQRFPDRTLAFSLPRIHEAPPDFVVPHPVSDDQLVRAYCALRVVFPTAELVLSTREMPALRNRLATICITQMSAGSCTTPGGYAEYPPASGQQFPVADQRSPADVAGWLDQAGFHVAWSID